MSHILFAGPVFQGLDPRFFILISLWVILPIGLFVASVVLLIRDAISKKLHRSTKIVLICLVGVIVLRMLLSRAV